MAVKQMTNQQVRNKPPSLAGQSTVAPSARKNLRLICACVQPRLRTPQPQAYGATQLIQLGCSDFSAAFSGTTQAAKHIVRDVNEGPAKFTGMQCIDFISLPSIPSRYQPCIC